MRTLYTLLFCLVFLPGLSAQTAADCAVDPSPTPIVNVVAQIGATVAYTAGIDVSYCSTTDTPFGPVLFGNLSFSEDTAYPYAVRVTDVTNAPFVVTLLENFNDNLDLFGDRLYFIEVLPEVAGDADLTFTPNGFGNPLVENVDVIANLPVTWAQPLDYTTNNKRVNFTWSVTDQINVADYRLQKSTGGEWIDVATLPVSQGRSAEISYTATDLHGVEDANYRVKQNDFDGLFSYSNIIVVSGSGLATKLSVFPNPASEVINFTNPIAITGLRLLNSAGRPLRELYDQGTNGTVSLAGLPAGVYLLELTDVNGERTTRRVLRR